jgi:single-strand DNA-binding protein
MNYNLVVLGGRLTRDPEIRYTQGGTAVAELNIAVNRRWKSEGGEDKEEVSFFNCTAFGRTAETIGQYMRKGSDILVDGRLKQETWEDKQTHANRSAIKVIIQTFQFVGGKKEGGQSAGGKGATPKTANQKVRESAESDGPPIEEDDVPF